MTDNQNPGSNSGNVDKQALLKKPGLKGAFSYDEDDKNFEMEIQEEEKGKDHFQML